MLSEELEEIKHFLENELNTSPDYKIIVDLYAGMSLIDRLNEIIRHLQILEEDVIPQLRRFAPIPTDDPKVVNFNAFKATRTPNKRKKL